jgi:uncharacterized protein
MTLLSRRSFLRGVGVVSAAPLAGTAYASVYEAGTALVSTNYKISPPSWAPGPTLRIAAIADIHAARPWIDERRIADIVSLANAMTPALTVLLGDFVCTHPFVSSYVKPGAWAEILSGLKAPLGVFAILGNHDWWSAAIPTNPPDGARSVREAIAQARIPLLENRAVRLSKDGRPFWIIGLGDQLANRRWSRHGHGADDLAGSLAQLSDDAPAILLAHEPFIFGATPDRIALTLSGHTHGGQVNFPFVGPVLAPTNGRGPHYIYGLYEDRDKRLIVSGGIGTSYAPIRVLRPPEVLQIDISPASQHLVSAPV